MRVHFDVLGWLYSLWGILGVLAGGSLLVIAAGALTAAGPSSDASGSFLSAVLLLFVAGLVLGAGGAGLVLVGRFLRHRRPRGRTAALLLAAPNLVLVPFGTALGAYALWVLLNDDARRTFGRPVRATRLS